MRDILLQQPGILKQLNRLYPEDEYMGLERLPATRNITYVINGVKGKYFFKLSPEEACEPLIREYAGIKEFYLRGGPVPRPLPVKDGSDYLIELKDTCYMVRGYEFIEGEVPKVIESSFHNFGITIGRFHNTWQPENKPSFLPEINLGNLIYEPLDDIADRFPNSRIKYFRKLGQGVAEVLSAHMDVDYLGITHGDMHHMNAIKASNGNMILIDLEDMGWQWRVYDLATAIWGTFGRGGGALIWNELITGYSSQHKLSKTEEMLIRYLIFARHLWWLGLYARNWELWPLGYTLRQFFEPGLELLEIIAKEVCVLDIKE